MPEELAKAFTSLHIQASKWRFSDLRIDIPAASFGSDAINPHTQYSNPIALMEHEKGIAIGSSFTLGYGNDMVCMAAQYIINDLDGYNIEDLLYSKNGFYETLTNPLQLRWISPNAGLPMMAAGLVVNTLLDAASKSSGMPAWEYLARMPSDLLIKLFNLRHLNKRYSRDKIKSVLDHGLCGIDARCLELKAKGLPVYYTTWIGHDVETISRQINIQNQDRGISTFKVKIGPNFQCDSSKFIRLVNLLPSDIKLCADANQTLSLNEAKRWLSFLSLHDATWLEEPFAPDNTELFKELIDFKRKELLKCEIVTGENCPNHYTAAALMESGIDRFQADPCRMLGLLDSMLVCIIASINGCTITPHAGGSSLDELSPHIQLFNLARVRTDIATTETLTENVGFCSHYFESPTIVENGCAKTAIKPGLLVGVQESILEQMIDYKEGITWLEL